MVGTIFKGGKIAEGDRYLINFSYTISSNITSGCDLYDWLVANAGYADEPDNVTITINASVQIGSGSTGTPGMTIDKSEFPAGCTIYIINNGEIHGEGGAGGSAGAAGSAGGGALLVQGSGCTLDIDNTSGEINGGGGGGGGGQGSYSYTLGGKECTSQCGTTPCTGGAGGKGYGPSTAASGSAGTTQDSCSCASCTGGTGGAGGGKGTAGSSGNAYSAGHSANGSAGSGGAAGYAVSGNSGVDNWTATGTRNGSVS